jgi:hypothetical protein
MFSYASLVPWWARALVVGYEAGALLLPVAGALLAVRRAGCVTHAAFSTATDSA